jgi:hypothetical protein
MVEHSSDQTRALAIEAECDKIASQHPTHRILWLTKDPSEFESELRSQISQFVASAS